MKEARWKLFGHILRRDPTIPANLAMKFYFEEKTTGFRGKPRTTLPVILNQDLEELYLKTEPHHSDHNYTKRLKLNNKEDLEKLRKMAEDRKQWKKHVYKITNAGEASASVDVEATPL